MARKKESRIEIRPTHSAKGTEFNIHLIAANGEQLLHGTQGYRDVTDATRAAEDAKAAAASAKIVVQKT